MVTRVNYSSQVRDSVFQAQSVSEVKQFYKALSLFDKLANKKENHIVYKLEQGKHFGISFGLSILSCFYFSQVTALCSTTRESCTGEEDTHLRLVGFDTCKVAMWIGMRSTAK